MLQVCSPWCESRSVKAKPCLGFCLVQKLFQVSSKVTTSVRVAGGKGVAVFVAAWTAVSFLVPPPPNFGS